MQGIELRPYQQASVDALRAGFANKLLRQILYLPTSGGKTLTALYMIEGAMKKGRRVIFICNRKALVSQASAVFSSRGIEHGILQGDNTRDLDRKVLIASIDTIASRGFPDDLGLIVIDEAHFAAGHKVMREMMFRMNKVPVIGLSATPFSRGLGKLYEELRGPLFQDIVSVVTIKDLIANGSLTDCDIYSPSAPDMSGCKLVGGDYTDKDAEERTNTPKLVGDILEHWMNLSYGKPTVVFASSIAHSRHIVSVFMKSGIPAEHLDAYTDDEERKAMFERFQTGETLILSNVGVLCEGWDAPNCHTMILARPTKSLIRYIQMIGRVLRPHESKKRDDGSFALVLDHSGTVKRLGFPTDDLPLVLDDGKPKKSEGSERKEKEESLPKECPECHFLKPPKTRKCPKCGLVATFCEDVETESGQLVLTKGKKASTKMDKQEVYSGLIWHAKSNGYQSGWVAHKYKTYFGVWPRGLDYKAAPPSDQLHSWIISQQIRFAHGKGKQNASR